MDHVLWISIGAVLGAYTRYWLGVWAAQRWGAEVLNMLGNAALGLLAAGKVTASRFPVFSWV